MDKKVTAKNTIQAYQGNVKITLLNGTKPYKVINKHNYGTAKFFEYIWKSVRGDNLNTKIPTYIFACDDGHNRLTNYGVVTEGQPDITPVDSASDRDDKATLTYTFLIPGTIVQNKTIASFQLVSLFFVDLNADVDLDNCLIINNNKKINIVEWSLILTNSTTQVQGEI